VAIIEAFGVSEPGPVRRGNEDAFCADNQLGLFVVADGMGGHAAGEVASSLAVEAIRHFIERSAETQDLSWPCGIDPALSYAGNRLRTAIYLANRRVFREAEGHNDYMGMGTTVVCALVTGSRLTIGHVGDSRLYALSNGVLSAETRDDTWAQSIMEDGPGGLAPDATRGHPMQHVLTNVLGVREQVEIHVAERELAPGDRFLLCTDGVHNVLDVSTLTDLLAWEGDPRRQAERVVSAAIDRKTRDNVTALIIHCDGAPEAHG
jgi:protein phosphatase